MKVVLEVDIEKGRGDHRSHQTTLLFECEIRNVGELLGDGLQLLAERRYADYVRTKDVRHPGLLGSIRIHFDRPADLPEYATE